MQPCGAASQATAPKQQPTATNGSLSLDNGLCISISDRINEIILQPCGAISQATAPIIIMNGRLSLDKRLCVYVSDRISEIFCCCFCF